MRARIIGAIGATALLIVGCAGTTGRAETTSAAGPTIQPLDQSSGSPLEAALGVASDPARRHHQLVELQERANQSVVDCMEAAGFYYAPLPVSAVLASGVHAGDGSREARAERGLGITLAFVEAITLDGTASDRDANGLNASYVSSLTEQQAADYDAALIGVPLTDAAADSYRPEGCWGAAFAEVIDRLELLGEFNAELDALNSRLYADPRVQALDERWSACMTAAGFEYKNESAMSDDIYARLVAVELIELGGATQFASQEAVDAVLAHEQAAALAGYDCRAPDVAELGELRADYEQEFLDDNRFRIEELRQG